MANPEHLAILKQGVEVWNRWREENPHIQPDLYKANLCNLQLSKTNFQMVNFRWADLSGANLTETDLSLARLRWATLRRVDLSKATLYKSDMREANLSEAIFSQANLRRARLRGAVLARANLTGANLEGADLLAANFNQAILCDADLYAANLINATLSGTDFSGANLRLADIRLADLNQANLTSAKLAYTSFGDIDLSVVKGLEQVEHHAPSTIGIDTLYRSNGKIPEVFLRGAGVPNSVINLAASIAKKDIGYYSCFISYSSQDEAFAHRLHADLQQKGVRCWFAPEDMKIGDKIRPHIDESIRIHDKLLLILSEHSINSSWVEKEVETAFEEERKRKQTVLFPVRLDEAVMETEQAWAADIRRTRHIGDFSRWKDHDSYQRAFERLLRDLKAEG